MPLKPRFGHPLNNPLGNLRRKLRRRGGRAPRWALTVGVVFLLCAGIYGVSLKLEFRARAAQAAKLRVEAVGGGGLRVKLQGGEAVRAEYVGEDSARRLLEQNQAAPLALAAGDFDEDGVPDLIAGYSAAGGGVLSLNRGNAAAIYPNYRLSATRAEAAGGGVSAFLSPGRVWSLTAAPDFVTVGDFNADGHADVVFAAKNRASLFLLAGDGKGNLGEAQTLALPGRVTSLASGEVNRADGLADLALAVATPDGARLLVYASPAGAWQAEPNSISLRQNAEALAVGNVDRDGFGDVAVGAGTELLVVRGRGTSAEGITTERVACPQNIKSVAIGSFAEGGRQVAALLDGGAVYMASSAEGQADSGGRGLSRRNANRLQSELYLDGGNGEVTTLIGAKAASGAHENLLLVGVGSRRLEVVGRAVNGSAAERARATFEVESPLVAALPMRLNADALSDFVVLREGAAQPAVIESAPEATFTVTSTADFGPGTLRDAINQANRNPGPDVILFSISSGGPQTITVSSSPLPSIDDAVTIDATSQPGFSGTPLIQLTSSAAGTFGSPGLFIGQGGGGTTVRGLVINNFANYGIVIQSSNNIIEGNYIGTNTAGTAAVPNAFGGIEIDGGFAAADNNRIGGTVAAARNVISGNGGSGVEIIGFSNASFSPAALEQAESAGGNVVQGNYIGTSANGLNDLGNSGNGIRAGDAPRLVVSNNVIAANAGFGVFIQRALTTTSTAGTLLQGNLIGLNATGDALGNGNGVVISGNGVTVGGAAAARNVISGNNGDGVAIQFQLATDNVVQGNYIGTDSAGTGARGNAGNGVTIGEIEIRSPATVRNSVLGNVIAFNGQNGVELISGSANPILSNSIHSNSGLGILRAAIANNNQAAPVLTSAVLTPTGVIVTGTLASTPSTGFTIQFFSNASCDPSGAGEGQTFLGQTTGTTNANGTLTFTATLTGAVTLGQVITATATSAGNDTSDFSRCLAVTAQADLSVTETAAPASPAAGATVTYTITLANNGPSNAANVTVTDVLSQQLGGPALTNVNCSATNGGVCGATTGSVVTVTYATLSAAPGSNTSTITITGTVPCLTQAAALPNSVSVTASTPDPVTANNGATASPQAQAGTVAAQTAIDVGSAINLGPVVVGSAATPPSATFTVTSTGCLPLSLTTAQFTRDIGTLPPSSFASLDDSRYFRLSVVNATGPETPLTPDSAGRFNLNRSLQTGQTLRLRVTFNPPFPAFAGQFAGRTGTFTAGQFLPDVVNSVLGLTSNVSAGGLAVPVRGTVSPLVQVVTREGFVLPPPAAAQGAEATTTPLVIFQRLRDDFRVAVSLYDPNLNVTKITYQFFDTYRQPASDPLEVPISSSLLGSLLRGQSFTVVQSFTGAAARPDVTYVRLTVEDADGAKVTVESNPLDAFAAAPNATPARLERTSDASVLSLPTIRLSAVGRVSTRSRATSGTGSSRKE